MSMMCFNNFDIGVVTHHFGCFLQQLKHDVNANAKIGGKDNRNIGGGVTNRLFTGFVKPRSADHHPFAMLATKSEMVQRTFRTGKIDKHIKIIFYRIKAALHSNACFSCTRQLTGVAAQ